MASSPSTSTHFTIVYADRVIDSRQIDTTTTPVITLEMVRQTFGGGHGSVVFCPPQSGSDAVVIASLASEPIMIPPHVLYTYYQPSSSAVNVELLYVPEKEVIRRQSNVDDISRGQGGLEADVNDAHNRVNGDEDEGDEEEDEDEAAVKRLLALGVGQVHTSLGHFAPYIPGCIPRATTMLNSRKGIGSAQEQMDRDISTTMHSRRVHDAALCYHPLAYCPYDPFFLRQLNPLPSIMLRNTKLSQQPASLSFSSLPSEAAEYRLETSQLHLPPSFANEDIEKLLVVESAADAGDDEEDGNPSNFEENKGKERKKEKDRLKKKEAKKLLKHVVRVKQQLLTQYIADTAYSPTELPRVTAMAPTSSLPQTIATVDENNNSNGNSKKRQRQKSSHSLDPFRIRETLMMQK